MSNTKLSILAPEQVPFFIRNENPNLELFLQKYYEFLEQNDQVINHITNFRKNIDVDEVQDAEMEDLIFSKFMKNFPDTTVANKNIILKNIKDFYRAKGTEKAVRFLVNILGGVSNTEVYLPKTDILKASGGKWFKQKTARVADITIDGVANNSFAALQKFTERLITGNTTNSSAIVESVNRTYEKGALISELYLSEIYNNFSAREYINATYTEEGEEHTISARIFGGQVRSIYINDPGSGYSVGDYINFVTQANNSGSGANAIITQVSTGNVRAIRVVEGGAGFRVADPLLIVGTGTGAEALVDTVATSEVYHPNTYNIGVSTIANVTNTLMSNGNTSIGSLLDYMVISGLGPATSIVVINPGSGYDAPPSANIIANNYIKTAGILGRMNIRSSGAGYAVGEKLNFTLPPGVYQGEGANGIVSSVDANGAITGVQFTEQEGFYIGGLGYRQSGLPYVTINTANGVNGNVEMVCILGYGEELAPINSAVGQISTISIIDTGLAYNSAPLIDMTGLGNGDANLEAIIIAGVYEYPGRYLDDGSFLSSTNYLRGRDYYQNYSYDIRSRVPMSKYKDVLLKVGHPSGLKVFGTYINEANPADTQTATQANVSVIQSPVDYLGTNLKAWWNADYSTYLTYDADNYVTSWRDIISNIDLVATSNARPLYQSNGFGETVATVLFDGNENYLSANSGLGNLPIGASNCEIWLLIESTNTSTNGAEVLLNYGSGIIDRRGVSFGKNVNNTYPLLIQTSNANTVLTNINLNEHVDRFYANQIIIRAEFGMNTTSISVNGNTKNTSAISTYTYGANVITMAARADGDSSTTFQGKIADVMITDALTGDQANVILAYLQTKITK